MIMDIHKTLNGPSIPSIQFKELFLTNKERGPCQSQRLGSLPLPKTVFVRLSRISQRLVVAFFTMTELWNPLQ